MVISITNPSLAPPALMPMMTLVCSFCLLSPCSLSRVTTGILLAIKAPLLSGENAELQSRKKNHLHTHSICSGQFPGQK